METDIQKGLWTQCGKERVGQMERTAWKHIHYHMQNGQQVGIYLRCGQLHPVLCGNLEEGDEDGGFRREWPDVYLWLIYVEVCQKPTQCCKAIILQNKKN